MTYAEFIQSKTHEGADHGFATTDLPAYLFDFQRDLVAWALRKGRAALFEDCGMGKTPQLLTWADQVAHHTDRPVLVLTPLAVAAQTIREGEKFGVAAARSRDGEITERVVVTNYERLHLFRPHDFAGVVCDESSILKSFDGATKAAVTEFMRTVQYRLLATATAAPNDWTELGTSSEALGDLGHMDMLSRFFINKEKKVSSRGGRVMRWEMSDRIGMDRPNEWRLKGHAAEPFWRWVSSWARAMRRPSDYGFADDGFVLPDLIERTHVIDPRQAHPDHLFETPAIGLAEERQETRRTLTERCEGATAILADADRAVAWCHLNDESAMLTRLIDDAVEVAGSDSDEAKEEKLTAFSRGEIRVLVTKPVIGAWGLNWQHAHRMTYFPSHSYEQYYQAVRRMWRFGQTRPVLVDAITTPGGQRVLRNLHRKAERADQMFARLIEHMNDALRLDDSVNEYEMEKPPWAS